MELGFNPIYITPKPKNCVTDRKLPHCINTGLYYNCPGCPLYKCMVLLFYFHIYPQSTLKSINVHEKSINLIYKKNHVRPSTWMPRPSNGERKVFSTNDSGKTEYLCKRMRLYGYLMPCTKLIQNGLKT